jgi:hypothetical protein
MSKTSIRTDGMLPGSVKRTLADILGFKTSEELDALIKENDGLKELLYNLQYSSNLSRIDYGTITREDLYKQIEQDFLEYKKLKLSGKDFLDLSQKIIGHINVINLLKNVAPNDFHQSVGMEGGTLNVTYSNIRIKDLGFEKSRMSAILNEFLRNHIPEVILFGDSFGAYYIEENFKGKKLVEYASNPSYDTKASFDIVSRYIIYASKMSFLIPPIKHHKENYQYKIAEITFPIIHKYFSEENPVIFNDFDSVVLSAFKQLSMKLLKNADSPFWDTSISNSKYSSDNQLAIFDNTKADILVNPVYDSVQVTFGYSERMPELKEIARKNSKVKNFDELWDLSVAYFLTRQIYHLDKQISKRNEDSIDGEVYLKKRMRKNYLSLLSSHEFMYFDKGKIIAEYYAKNY